MGDDGRRDIWWVTFCNQDNSKQLNVDVVSGKVVRAIEGVGGGTPIENINDLIDSDEAVQIAKTQKGLRPGEVFAIGYHFELLNYDDGPMITVFGRSPANKFARVLINAKTKKVEEAIQKVDDHTWEDF